MDFLIKEYAEQEIISSNLTIFSGKTSVQIILIYKTFPQIDFNTMIP
jgi:hypothetical protein